MQSHSVRKLTCSALIAAVYAALTVATGFMSFGSVQFRIAEALCILPFFFPFSTYGLFVGCLLANLVSPVGPADVVFGSLATLLSCCCVALIGKNGQERGWGHCIAACLMPVLWNGIIIGSLLALTGGYTLMLFPSLMLMFGASVALGEAVVMLLIGLPLLRWLPKSSFLNLLRKYLDNPQ